MKQVRLDEMVLSVLLETGFRQEMQYTASGIQVNEHRFVRSATKSVETVISAWEPHGFTLHRMKMGLEWKSTILWPSPMRLL